MGRKALVRFLRRSPITTKVSSPLALSSDSEVAVDCFGVEQQPLVRVEYALSNVAEVREIAARHRYKPIGPFYPGVRAAVSERVSMPLVAPLMELLQQTFALDRKPAFFECYLSIVTTNANQLDPIQRLPHFDGLERERIAVLLYLDPQERGGTAFYRQRVTGFESVDVDRFDEYRTQLEVETTRSGLPEPAYIDGDTPLFERIHHVAPKLGRMIAYRGNTLHCAALQSRFVPDPDPISGRLTLNLFLY